MRKFWSVLFVLTCWFTFGSTSAFAQACPPVGSNAMVRFANVHVNCATDSLYVDVQLANPTGVDFSASSLSLRFTFNTSQLSNPTIHATTMTGSHTLQVQSGIWSYGLIEFSGNNVVPAGGTWKTVGTLAFHVNSFNAGSNSRCLDLTWHTTSPAITTGQQWISFLCQPNLVYTSYGDNTTCISDSCSPGTSVPLTASATSTNVTCTGTNNGTVTLSVSGGATPYSFHWSNGATTQNLSGLAPNTYTVTVTDANSATTTASATVGAAGLTIGATVANSSCNASDDGSITLNVTGGNGTYTYNWSDGVHTQNRTFLTPGTYSVTVIDGSGCSGTRSFTITEPAPYNYRILIKNVSCANGSDGVLTVTAAPGGTAPYVYIWHKIVLDSNFNIVGDSIIQTTNSATGTDVLSNLSAGLYELELTDANGCPGAVFYLISQPDPIVITGITGTPTPVRCYGTNTGAIGITAAGGTGVIRFHWSDGDSTQNRNNLYAGTYTVTATDLNGCTASKTFIVTQPDSIHVSLSPTGNSSVSCNGGHDGAIDVTVSGGTGPLTYHWSNGATTQDISGLAAGTYTLTVTDSLGCVKPNFSVTIVEPALLVATATTDSALCNGASNGAIHLTVTGGNGGYTFLWTPGNYTTQNLSGLPAGTYHVLVTDSKGCTATTNATINQPVTVGITLLNNSSSCIARSTGALSVKGTGGTQPYTYVWSNGGLTASIGNLAAGSYRVTVTDAHSCTAAASYVVGDTVCTHGPRAENDTAYTVHDVAVNIPVLINDFDSSGNTLTVTSISTPPVNGTVSIVPGGGSVIYNPAPGFVGVDSFTYITCDNGIPSLCDSAWVFVFVRGGGPLALPDTAYTVHDVPVTIPVMNNDTDSSGYPIHVTTVSVPPVNGTTNVNGNGTITYIPNTGFIGVDSFTYVICDNGRPVLCDDTLVFVFVRGGGPLALPDTAYTASGVPVTVPVMNNDSDSSGFPIHVTTVSIPPVHGSTNINGNGTITYFPTPGFTGVDSFTYVICDNGNPVLCADTLVFIFVRGGGPLAVNDTVSTQVNTPITVSVLNNDSDSSGFPITVTGIVTPPTNGTTTINGGTTVTYTPGTNFIGVDSFQYVICDNGVPSLCDSAWVFINVQCNLTASIRVDQNISCNGLNNGAITAVTTTSAIGPLTYAWSNAGAGNVANQTGLPAGTYTVTITDAAHCTATASATITEPTPLAVTSSVTNVTCAGGTNGAITLGVSGGTTPYSFAWSNAATSQNLTGIAEGIYSVTVTDAHGCSATLTLGVNTLNTLILNTAATDANCGQSDGVASVSVSGGGTPYIYAWTGGASSQSINNLAVGGYGVTVTDSHGCTASSTVTVSNTNSPLNIASLVVDDTCGSATHGSISLVVGGGLGTYSYAWSNGPSTQSVTGLTAGTYSVTVSDGGGCSTVRTFTIKSVSSLALTVSSTDATCGTADGSLSVSATGGNGTYTYHWSNGATTANPSSIAAGVYFVTVTDGSGCSNTASVTVNNINGPAIGINTITNITCATGTGAVDLTVTGGTGPYTYAWSNGVSTQNQSNLSAGPYTLTVTDANGCKAVSNITIRTATPIVVVADPTNPGCSSAAGGSIDVSVNGGTAPYTYLWSNGATTASLSGLSSGTYTVTVTDANGCSASTPVVISAPQPLALSFNNTDVTCAGGSNGAINLTVSGGTAPYTYVWSNGANTQNLSGLQAGLYTVKVTDANGCTATATLTINTLNTLVLNTAATDATCGNADGVATVSVSGGNAPFSYAWAPIGSGTSVSNLAAGVYTVTVTDAHGCTASSPIVVTNTNSTLNVAALVTDDTCGSTVHGAISLAVGGGIAPYTYVWSIPGTTTPSITGLSAGTYNVTINDAAGCATVRSFTVHSNSGLSINLAPQNATCSASTGSVASTVSGGNGVYTYHWNTGATTANLSNVAGGGYFVTVTDGNGCSATQFTLVSTTGGPAISITNVTNITCANGTGSASISVTGGVAPYTYAWSNGTSTQNQASLNGGLYAVTVTDANGCSSVSGVQISVSAPIIVVADRHNPACSSTAGGSIDVTVTGGVGPYTYAWSNGATTSSISGLTSGTYTVSVTDANGCSVSTPAVITAPLPIAIRTSVTNVLCSGGNNGAITLILTGGTAPYTFHWSTGATTQNLNNLTAGLYTVTVTDAGGCTATKAISVLTINSLVLNTGSSDASCGLNNGYATVSVSGGSGTYTYHWSNGRNTAVDSLIAAGNYTVTVTDGVNGCTATANVSVGNITSLAINGAVSDARCGANNGSITLTVSGGSPSYTYNWTGGATTPNIGNLAAGTYNVTVTDTTGCSKVAHFTVNQVSSVTLTASSTPSNCGGASGTASVTINGAGSPSILWSTGATTTTITGVTAGVYSVTVTDGITGCSANALVTVGNNGGPTVTVDSVVNLSCANGNTGSITIGVSGAGPFSFYWSDSATTQNISGLYAGTYAVTVTDGNGCIGTAVATVAAPNAMVLVADQQNVRCSGDSSGLINTTVTGGVAPYSYTWSNGSHATNITGLTAGTYGVTITDANGCVAFTPVIVSQPQPIVVSLDSSHNVACNGTLNGMIHVSVTVGVGPYTYHWSNGASGNYLTGLGAGTYCVTVTDASGCTNRTPFCVTLTQPGNLSLNLDSITAIKCNGGTGCITVVAAGGTAPYVFTWNDGAHGATHCNLIAGSYSVTVADSSGCSVALTGIALTQPTALAANVNGIGGLCAGYTDGTVIANVSGGTTPYHYAWTGGATTDTVTGLSAGSYTVTVTDANGCSATANTTLRSIDSINIAGGSVVVQPTCADSTSGSITLHVTGGTGAYHYTWSASSSTDSVRTGLGRGSYTVTVTDENACSKSYTFTLSPGNCGPRPIAVDDTAQTFSNHSVIIPVLNNDTFVGIVVPIVIDSPNHGTVFTNGDGTVTYKPDTNFVGVDTFTYVICDANGCDTANVYVIVLPDRPNVQIPNGFSPNGDGTNDYFVIPDLDKYPGSQLIVFNRWGNHVWESDKSGYINNWNGVNQNNEPLPDGTYFYIITIKDGLDTKYEGFVTIQR